MRAPSFRTFIVERLSWEDGIMIELADIDGREMLIATDTEFLSAPNKYYQQAHGFVDHYSDDELVNIAAQLRGLLFQRRRAV